MSNQPLTLADYTYREYLNKWESHYGDVTEVTVEASVFISPGRGWRRTDVTLTRMDEAEFTRRWTEVVRISNQTDAVQAAPDYLTKSDGGTETKLFNQSLPHELWLLL